jgi:S-adenosylhomocysteine hydrolase
VHNLSPLHSLGNYKTTFNNDLDAMWKNIRSTIKQNNFDMMIVLDDGGRNLEYVYNDISINIPIVGIEQTTAGLFNPHVLALPVPFIDVAASAAKVFIEPKIIAYEILSKIIDYLPCKPKGITCGVVGLGTIGKAVTRKLLELGCETYFYERQAIQKDDDIEKAKQVNSLDELISGSDYIFGCTGRDISKSLHIEKVSTNDKFFISCSSEDKEFLALLRYIEKLNPVLKRNPLDTLTCRLKNGATITILGGGFPINFDRISEAAPPEMIQITRGLLLGAIIQATIMENNFVNNNKDMRIALDAELQKFIVNSFKQHVYEFNLWSHALFNKFNDINWIANNSSGIKLGIDYFSSLPQFATPYIEADLRLAEVAA